MRPYSVYSTWGFHDELGDTVRVSEELCLRALDRLEAWRDRHGFGFDYFHIDAFWFDRTRPYDRFDPEMFPDGPDRILERVSRMGLKFGLWFAVNGGHMRVPSWEPSRATVRWCYSLCDGPFADDLERALHLAAERWGCRLFKFDFAAWTATADPSRPAEEARRLSLRRFRSMIEGLRRAYPDAVLFAHCGFAATEQSTVSGSPTPLAVDSSWLSVLDRVFSGDPHPIDVPQTSLVRNIDLYQDRQVWALHAAGFPLHRIEDHGVLVGTTNTCCYRGRAGFPRSCLGQLARGGRRHLLYGNPEVLTEDDVRFMKSCRDLYFDAYGRGLETSFVGAGEPGLAPWHGYLTGGGAEGLLYLVNPGPERRLVELTVAGLEEAACLFTDGPEPAVQVQADLLLCELEPEQCVLLGLGRYADGRWRLPGAVCEPLPRDLRAAAVVFRETAPRTRTAEAEVPSWARRCVVQVQVFDEKPEHVRRGLPFRFAKQFASGEAGGGLPPSQAHDLVRVELLEDGEPVEAERSVPSVPVWSGISWVCRVFPVSGGRVVVRVTEALPETRRLAVRVFWTGG